MLYSLPPTNMRVSFQNFPIQQITQVHPHDVLCGRGISVNKHVGNKMWRDLIRDNMAEYCRLPRSQRQQLTHSIVMAVRSLSPPGRFLMLDSKTRTYYDIGDAKANLKTSQAMRDTKKRMPLEEGIKAAATVDSEEACAMIPPALTRPVTTSATIDYSEYMRAQNLPTRNGAISPTSPEQELALPVVPCSPPLIPKPMPMLKRMRSDDTFHQRIQNIALVLPEDDSSTSSMAANETELAQFATACNIPVSIECQFNGFGSSESSIDDMFFEDWPADVDVLDLY